MAYNISADLWYQYFTSSGPQWLVLLGVYGFRALWSTIGIIFNLSIVYITVKTSSLRSICNILIAMESGFALILDLGYFVSFFVVLSGTTFIPYAQCFWALILPCLFGEMALPLMVFTGLDRVFAVAFPFWYKQRNPRKYLASVAAVIFAYGIYVFVLHYIDCKATADIMLSCSSHEMGQSFLAPVMKINGLTLSAMLIVVYSFCWFFVFKYASTSQHVTENNRKLIKSLLFIIALNLIGVFIKCAIDIFLQTFLMINAFIQMPYTIAFSFFTITVYSVNAPVLYVVSVEYRARFDYYFPWIGNMYCMITRQSAQVAPQTASHKKPFIVINNGIGPGPSGG